MIGELRSVVFDCRDPRAAADFWAGVLGGTVVQEQPHWVVLTDPSGRRLAFQLSPEHEPPRFPDPRASQQMHLDVAVDDIDAAQARVLELGATRVSDAIGESDFRVFRDPAGHTFCLLFDVDG